MTDDKPKTTLADGSPVTDDHRKLRIDGQQKGYVVLSAEERAKGFVEPVRYSYIHSMCGMKTTMGPTIAETFARDPNFYGGTFCSFCKTHFALEQFKWSDTEITVGTRSTGE